MNKKRDANKNIHILIAEDSSVQAEMLSNILEQQGYRVAVANDGRQALALLKESKPALVISDILMPEMTGFELCQQIKADVGTRDIPVILLTALSNSTDVLEGLAWGADSFITKPYNKEFLLAHVAQTLEGRLRSRRESDRVEVEIPYAGRPRLLHVEPQRLITLLISAYEAAVCRNKELVQTQNELSSLSARLEDMVEQRTEALSAEIEERKQAEEAIRESEARYHLLIDNAQFPVVVVSAVDNRVLFINKHASRLFEVPADQAVGLRASEFWYRKKDLYRFVRLIKEQGTVKDFETELRSTSGARMSVMLSSNLVQFAGQQADITVFQDITARKRAERELLEAKALVETVVEHIPLMIFLKEATDLKFVIFNRAGEELLGYDRKALLGKNSLDLFPPEQAVHFMAKDREALAGHELVDIPEEFIQTAKKGVRLLHTRKVSIMGDDGTTKYLLGISEDITESKKAEVRLQETLLGLRKALGGIIQVLSAVSEIRDPYTAGHQKRVSDLARAIAQELGLAPARVEGIRVAGVIHDIGKMSIPAEILSKPAVLSKIEYALIQSHVQIGHDILSEIEFAWPVAAMVLQHHERMDGSGYPQRLKGDDILLEARILAVADVIEAMASHRPYRPALGIEAALREIENDKGVLYDPAVVEACLTLFRDKGFKLKD